MKSSLRMLVVLALLRVVAACSATDHVPGDESAHTGHDAGTDTGHDVGVDANRDFGVDAGCVRTAEGGWEQLPYLPCECHLARRPVDPAAIVPIRFEPCVPAVPGCERAVPNWPPLTVGGIDQGLWGMNGSIQSGSIPGVFAVGGDRGLILMHTDGSVITEWETRFDPDPSTYCIINSIAASAGRVQITFALSAAASPIVLLSSPLTEIATTSGPTTTFGANVVGVNVQAWELDYDGTDLAVLLYPGYVYVSRFGASPWDAVAYAGTNDSSTEAGMFWPTGGTPYFYWDSYAAAGGLRRRVRRSPGHGAVPETFIDRGNLVDVGGFRTDGTWAVWVERRFTNATDDWPTSSAIVAARTNGVMDPSTWSPRDISFPPAINHINQERPLMSHGRYAFRRSSAGVQASQPEQMELIDLNANRRVVFDAPADAPHAYFWATTVVYLDDTYLFAVLNDAGLGIELRRYTIAQLQGWVPIP